MRPEMYEWMQLVKLVNIECFMDPSLCGRLLLLDCRGMPSRPRPFPSQQHHAAFKIKEASTRKPNRLDPRAPSRRRPRFQVACGTGGPLRGGRRWRQAATEKWSAAHRSRCVAAMDQEGRAMELLQDMQAALQQFEATADPDTVPSRQKAFYSALRQSLVDCMGETSHESRSVRIKATHHWFAKHKPAPPGANQQQQGQLGQQLGATLEAQRQQQQQQQPAAAPAPSSGPATAAAATAACAAAASGASANSRGSAGASQRGLSNSMPKPAGSAQPEQPFQVRCRTGMQCGRGAVALCAACVRTSSAVTGPHTRMLPGVRGCHPAAPVAAASRATALPAPLPAGARHQERLLQHLQPRPCAALWQPQADRAGAQQQQCRSGSGSAR